MKMLRYQYIKEKSINTRIKCVLVVTVVCREIGPKYCNCEFFSLFSVLYFLFFYVKIWCLFYGKNCTYLFCLLSVLQMEEERKGFYKKKRFGERDGARGGREREKASTHTPTSSFIFTFISYFLSNFFLPPARVCSTA